jgi:lysophospholipase L1-like esterase
MRRRAALAFCSLQVVLSARGVAMKSELPIKILALGDSYTIGESVDAKARWPEQLAQHVRQKLRRDVGVQIIAQTGWSTDELSAALDQAEAVAAIQAPYALVTLLIGVNNQYRNRSVDAYRTEFTELLQRAIGYAGGCQARVLVLSIPDWGKTPFAQNDARGGTVIAHAIDAFNAAARQQSQALGVHFIDITELSRAPDLELLAGDGLHPSAKAYAEWADKALPVVLAALGL